MLHAWVRHIVGKTGQKAIRRRAGVPAVPARGSFAGSELSNWALGMKLAMSCSVVQARGFPVEKYACEKGSRAVSLEAMLAA